MAVRARATSAPGYIEPMRATLVREAFDDPDWLFETKWDGFRVEAVVAGGTVELWTRGHQDASRYFGRFLEPPTWIKAGSAVVDGEVQPTHQPAHPHHDLAGLVRRAAGVAVLDGVLQHLGQHHRER